MTFKRVGKHTINCIISADDMDEQGLRIEDLIEKKKEAMDFLHEVMDRAKEEVDYNPTGNMTPLQITVLPDRSISLTLSENSDEAFKSMLRELTDKLGLRFPKEFLEDLGDSPVDERLLRLTEYVEQMKNSGKAKGLDKIQTGISNFDNTDLSDRRSKIATDKKTRQHLGDYCFEFDSYDDLFRLCTILSRQYVYGSSLYKNRENNKYYMFFYRNGLDDELFATAFTRAYEYGHFVSSDELTMSYMRETYDCLIAEDALNKIGVK